MKRTRSGWLSVFLFLLLISSFQNCTGGFTAVLSSQLGQNQSRELSKTANGGPLPPTPLIDDQAILARKAMNTLATFDWSQVATGQPLPNVGFPFLHPGSNSNDLRIKTDNCDQVGIPNSSVGGADNKNPGVCLFTSNPEAFTGRLEDQTFAALSKPYALSPNDFFVANPSPPKGYVAQYGRGRRFLCDVNNLSAPAVPGLPNNQNPFACDGGGAASASGPNDCYDMTHLGTLLETTPTSQTFRLAGRRIRVVVSNPKTATAAISNVVFLGPPVNGPAFTANVTSLFTPQVSGDGKLLIVSGQTNPSLLFSYSETPCDPQGWTKFLPITVMYQDPTLRAKYGIARFPIRDSENQIVKPVYDSSGNLLTSGIVGTYLWLDTKASMLFYNAGVGNRPYFLDSQTGQVVQRYPVHSFQQSDGGAPITDTALLACNNQPSRGEIATCFNALMSQISILGNGDEQMAYFGLWTNGKVVVPDSILNKNTLGMGGGKSGDVVMITHLYSGGQPPWALTDNMTLRKAGFENGYNHLQTLLPNSPSDVVWRFSTHESMAELPFDDSLHPENLIVSPMNASLTQRCESPGFCYGQINDGYVNSFTDGTANLNGQPHIQNIASSFSPAMAAATSSYIDKSFTGWDVPSYGILHGGRIEPVPAGGVGNSAGLFLNGQNWVKYPIPADNSSAAMQKGPWFYSLWIDPRGASSGTLFSLSDGSTVALRGPNALQVIAAGSSAVANFSIPQGLLVGPSKWTHIALAASADNGNTNLSLYLNGFHLADQVLAGLALFPTPGGKIFLGGQGGQSSFIGWVEDFKVRSRIPDVEEVCREALGTLVGLKSAADGEAWTYALNYPISSHVEINTLLAAQGIAFNKFFCELSVPKTQTPNAPDRGTPSYCMANFRNTRMQPEPSRCVGDRLVFPEGPIVPGAPRPNSIGNAFCLSCHIAGHPSTSLQPVALVPSSPTGSSQASWIDATGFLKSEADPKRRPSEAVQWALGVIPKDLYCPGKPKKVRTAIFAQDLFTNQCVAH